jgi:hypothetical protein
MEESFAVSRGSYVVPVLSLLQQLLTTFYFAKLTKVSRLQRSISHVRAVRSVGSSPNRANDGSSRREMMTSRDELVRNCTAPLEAAIDCGQPSSFVSFSSLIYFYFELLKSTVLHHAPGL